MNKKWKILIGWSLFILIFDQLTKYLINLTLPQGGKIEIIRGFFDLVHYRNRGAAFGMLVEWESLLRTIFLFAVSLFAFGFLIYYFHRTPPAEKKILVCLSLIFGGAVGNLIDRVFRGSVIDFILLHWQDKISRFQFFGKSYAIELVWPAFNVADSAITVGVILLLGIHKEFFYQLSKNFV